MLLHDVLYMLCCAGSAVHAALHCAEPAVVYCAGPAGRALPVLLPWSGLAVHALEL